MFCRIIWHTVLALFIYINGLRATPTPLDQLTIPASILDNGHGIDDVPVPYLQLQAFVNVYANLAQSHPITIPEGTRVNVEILGYVIRR